MEFQVCGYTNDGLWSLTGEIIYEGPDVNAGIHAVIEFMNRVGDNFSSVEWYGRETNGKRKAWVILPWM